MECSRNIDFFEKICGCVYIKSETETLSSRKEVLEGSSKSKQFSGDISAVQH